MKETILDVKTLIDYFNHGVDFEFLFFWRHTSKEGSKIGRHCLSQWFPAKFRVDGTIYHSAEHYMMAEKARLFGDYEILNQILKGESPSEAKKLGRKVRNFREDIWCENRFEIVVKGNFYKFSQNIELLNYLMSTGDKVLVEASPKDKIWGIGLSADNPKAQNPNLWRGLNLLGFALMDVRRQLKVNFYNFNL